MIVGSFASAYHGIPRSIQALDIVVSLELKSLEPLSSALSAPGRYLSREAVEEAMEHRGQFNLSDGQSGWKVDFIVCKNREFSQRELGRRRRVILDGYEVFIASAEDTISIRTSTTRCRGHPRCLRLSTRPRISRQLAGQAGTIRGLRQSARSVVKSATLPDRDAFLRPLLSLLAKSEKALGKLSPGTRQHTMLSHNVTALRFAIELLSGAVTEVDRDEPHPAQVS